MTLCGDFEAALPILIEAQVCDIQGDLLIIRLPGKTAAAKHSELMRQIASRRWIGEAADPLTWAIAMGALIMLGRHFDVLCFLDASTKTLSIHHEPEMIP
jgi:hypothetical protein